MQDLTASTAEPVQRLGGEAAPFHIEGFATGFGQASQLLHDAGVLAWVDGGRRHTRVWEGVHCDRLPRMLLADILQYLSAMNILREQRPLTTMQLDSVSLVARRS